MADSQSERKKLISLAIEAKKNAYCPYSQFRVGCALETEEGKLFTGCNVENASYSTSICAERTALVKAVSEGYTKIKTIVVASDSKTYVFPCGVCRQMIGEFSSHGRDSDGDRDETQVVIVHGNGGDYLSRGISQVIPDFFGADQLFADSFAEGTGGACDCQGAGPKKKRKTVD